MEDWKALTKLAAVCQELVVLFRNTMTDLGVSPAIVEWLTTGKGREVVRVAFLAVGQAYQDRYLRRLPGGENLIIAETDGSRTLAEARDVFAFIDSVFSELNTGACRDTSPPIAVAVREMRPNVTYRQIIESLSGGTLDDFVLPEDKIIQFCLDHRDWLSRDYYTVFFFRTGNQFSAACVSLRDDGQSILGFDGLSPFSIDVTLNTEGCCCHRVVLPNHVANQKRLVGASKR
ncbi:MAG: hypothetical protein HYV76_00550 [Candidatus Vogelbacteria bacterium]|nr:hypothetical protein [Candidatus Vogelbacteria bacterium]